MDSDSLDLGPGRLLQPLANWLAVALKPHGVGVNAFQGLPNGPFSGRHRMGTEELLHLLGLFLGMKVDRGGRDHAGQQKTKWKKPGGWFGLRVA